jgi:glycerophosphoryl diester phosphodiesterase
MPPPPGDHKIHIIGHRGTGPTSVLSGDGRTVPNHMAPENTIQAFRRAVEQGADGIEFDVIVTKDGVPVVVHDDELNRNVEGAARKGTEMGRVSEKTLQEVQQYNVGHGEKIPSLRETLNYITEANAARVAQGKKPLIVNIELKTKGTAEMAPIAEMVHEYIGGGKINNADVIFCSFDHPQLAALKTQNPEFQIAPSIKTATLYGKENILMPGFRVKPGSQYDAEGLKYLQDFHDKTPTVAMDAVLWDAANPLVKLSQKNGIALHLSTSDYREYGDAPIFTRINQMSRDVPIYFKADEPALAREQIFGIKQDFNKVSFATTKPMVNQTLSTVDRQMTLQMDLPFEKPVPYSEKILAQPSAHYPNDLDPPGGHPLPVKPDATMAQQVQQQQGKAAGGGTTNQSSGAHETSRPKIPPAVIAEAAVETVAIVATATKTQTPGNSRATAAVKAAGAPIGVAMGAKGMYDKLHDQNSNYHKDVAAGGTRQTMANVSLGADGATLVAGTVQSAHDITLAAKTLKTAGQTAEAAEGLTGALGVAGKVAGRVAIPLAIVAGAAETGTAIAAKDGHRAAQAVGGTVGGIAGGVGGGIVGGILGGMATGALAGSVVPGLGTAIGAGVGLIVGIGGALLGGWLGSKGADAAAGDWADKKLHEHDAPPPKSAAQVAKEQEMGQWQGKLDSYQKALQSNNETGIKDEKTKYEAYLNGLKAKGYIDEKTYTAYNGNSQRLYDGHEKALQDAKKATEKLHGTKLHHAEKAELHHGASHKHTGTTLAPQH